MKGRLAACLAVALGALALTACPGDDTPPTADSGSAPAWQVVLDQSSLDRAVLSIWGSSPSDVFAVGGPLGNTGLQTLALHFDGETWTDLAPGGAETFWWVNGSSPSDVWMVGEQGRIAHWDGAKFAAHDYATTATLWGVKAFSTNDAWAVGGTPEQGTGAPNDLVLHWDGKTWTQEPLPGAPLGRTLFKVWGTSSHDLYAVGEAGTVWHRKGATWTLESSPPIAKGTLFTVNGCSATEVYAVGGQDVLESDGTTWKKLAPPLSNQVNGVSCGAPGEIAIVGFGGLKQRLVKGAWVDDFLAAPHGDLHATWGEGGGVFWAVGGDFISKPVPMKPRAGIIARFGPGTVPGTLHQ